MRLYSQGSNTLLVNNQVIAFDFESLAIFYKLHL